MTYNHLVKRVCFAALLLLPTACTPLYLPPVPNTQDRTVEIAPRLNLTGSSGLRLRGDRLELSVFLTEVPEEGWLSVQWFSPQNRQAASDSLWITEADVDLSRFFVLPEDVALQAGQWSAVVSYDGNLIRQFSIAVGER